MIYIGKTFILRTNIGVTAREFEKLNVSVISVNVGC